MRHAPLQLPLIWQSYLLLWALGILACVWTLPALLAALFLLGLDRRLHKLPRLGLALLILAAGFCWSHWHFAKTRNLEAHTPEWTADATDIRAKIQSVQGLPDKRLRLILENVRPQNGGEALAGLCAWTWEKPPQDVFPLAGQEVCLSRPLRIIRGFANDEYGDLGINSTMFARNIYWRAYSYGPENAPVFSGRAEAGASLRADLRKGFLHALGAPDISQPKAMLLALIFGDRQYLSQNTVGNFAAATLAHSLALSGQHLSVAGLIGICLVFVAARCRPQLYLSLPRLIMITLASLAPAFIYLWLGNAPASLIRAVCMLAVLAVLLWRGRNFSGADILCLALALILAWNPMAIFDIGLQLSVLCLAVLTISGPAFNRHLPAAGHCNPAWVWLFRIFQILAVSLLIQLALLPMSILRFHLAGCWFALNIVWLPLLGFIVLPLAALGLLLSLFPFLESVAILALDAAALPCGFILWLLNFIKHHGLLAEPAFLHPHWLSILAFALLLVALSWIFSNDYAPGIAARGKKLLLACLFLLAAGPAARLLAHAEGALTLEALDVGQGQAILINFPDSGRVLIDGGGSPGRFDLGKNVVAPLLSANQEPRLSAVVNSHPDFDHLGGLFHTLAHFRVEQLFHNGNPAQGYVERRWRPLRQKLGAKCLRADDRIILGPRGDGLALEVLHPAGGEYLLWEGNDASIILRLSRNGQGLALIPGDAGLAALEGLLAEKRDVRAKILVAPHHGSDHNFSPEFIKAVRPELVLISCGYKNRYGFPGASLTTWLKEQKIPFVDTASEGKITISFNKDGSFRLRSARGTMAAN